MGKIQFTVVCASKNEESHIHDLIMSFKKVNLGNAELIIVDDSDDDTRSIANEYKNKNIRILNGNNTGCCNARNTAVKESYGDIITYMTADSLFPNNFFQDIKICFYQGYDIVMTRSKVQNTENIWSRYIDSYAHNRRKKEINFSPLTSQGYSVKKSSAIAAGLIDEGSSKPNICRDWTLVKKMEKMKHSKIYAKHIICYHKAPSSFYEFVENQYTRGVISGGTSIRYNNRSIIMSYFRSLVKLIVLIASILIPIMVFLKSVRMTRFTNLNDLTPFFIIFYLKNLSFIIGEFFTIFKFNIGYYKK